MKKMLGMLAIIMLGASLSFAQTADNANSDRGTGTPTTQNGNNNDNRGPDWGWLGLLGLAGLGGLRGRRRDTASQRDRDVSNIRRAA
jgi:MYXO-CTERM domain-containing protein